MVNLQQATSTSPDQQPRLLRLQADITTKMNELASTITAMRRQGYDAAKTIVTTDVGRLSMGAISADLATIMDAAEARLYSRLDSAAAAERQITLTFIFGSIISAIALMLGAFLLARALPADRCFGTGAASHPG